MMSKNYDLIFQCIQLLNIIFGKLITVYLTTGINNLFINHELAKFTSDKKKLYLYLGV